MRLFAPPRSRGGARLCTEPTVDGRRDKKWPTVLSESAEFCVDNSRVSLTLYRTTAAGLLSSPESFEQQIVARFEEVMLHAPGESERRSWRNSLPALASLLVDANLSGVEILVEYRLPLSSRRADALLIGTDEGGFASVLVCELKQWSAAEIEDADGRIVSVAGRLLTHPQQQVAGYVEYIADFIPLFDTSEAEIGGFVFLHNAASDVLDRLRVPALADLQRFPMFGGDQMGELRELLASRLRAEGAALAADRFLQCLPRPSKPLLKHAAEQIAGQEAFKLVDNQRLAFDLVKSRVEEAKRSDTKTAIIVRGGPGTGKSVIATQLVGQLASVGYRVLHATGSRSFTITLREKVGRRAANLFKYFNSFMNAIPNDLDALICDEAHRIRESSNDRWTRKQLRSERTQVEELLRAARVPVFLLDENQVVRPNEVGTRELIRHEAEALGMAVEEVELDGQFRCGGSAAYVHWVERLLGLLPGGPIAWAGDEPFEMWVAADPFDLERWILDRQESGYTARLSAGFCWPWSDPDEHGSLVEDVVIDGWKRPWNLRGDRAIGGAPPSALWASDPAGVGQVGCIYTAQGFEYDYAGVILGGDLVWRDGQWASNKGASRDGAVLAAENFDELVRHVYKVLLTRGLLGCGLFSVDRRTNEFLGSVVGARQHRSSVPG